MPTLNKTNHLWTGNIQRQGYPRRVKKGFKTKSEAREWERLTWLEMTAEQNPLEKKFSLVCTEYLCWCEKRRELNTFRQKKFIIKSLISSFQTDPSINQIIKTNIETYLDQRFYNSGGKAANRDLREIKTLFNWCIDRDFCKSNPCHGIEKYKTDQFIKYVPPPEDINSVLLKANDFEYDFIQCIYHLAARLSEVQNLKWEDINFKTRTLKLWTKKRAGGSYEADELSINSILLEILENRYVSRNKESTYVFPNKYGHPISKNTLDKIMPRLCNVANVKRFGFHAIRHHVSAVMADSKKLSLIEIQKQLRHKRATTTDVYLKSIVTGENTASTVLENAQKKDFHTKIHTLRTKNGTNSD